MASSIFSVISEEHISQALEALHGFSKLNIRLFNNNGKLLLSFGQERIPCVLQDQNVFTQQDCFRFCADTGQHINNLKETPHIYTCSALHNYISYPLSAQEHVLGSVVVGPFLTNAPDWKQISRISEEYQLSISASLELYVQLEQIPVYTSEKTEQLRTLLKYILTPMIPGSQSAFLLPPQTEINAPLQPFRDEKDSHSLAYFHQKEKELLSKVRSGTTYEVKGLLNDLIGYVLFSSKQQVEPVRVRSIELTTLLSRVAIDGGAQLENVYYLNSQFISKLYQQQSLEDICLLMQDVLERFMNAMFCGIDKGNPHIRKALRYMMDNYSEHLTLNQVAEFVQLSPSYFSALFREIVGVSFREQLCQIRVEESKHLLLMSQYTLADIAVSMGFPDQSYYCKVFKRIVGISPSKFRG